MVWHCKECKLCRFAAINVLCLHWSNGHLTDGGGPNGIPSLPSHTMLLQATAPDDRTDEEKLEEKVRESKVGR